MSIDIDKLLKNKKIEFNSFTKFKELQKIDVLSSGSKLIDRITGIDGFPKGGIVEIFGSESSGKTSLAINMIKYSQKNNITTAFVDGEQSFNYKYAKGIGVDLSKMIFYQPESAESAFNAIYKMCADKKIKLIVLDSIASLVTEEQINNTANEKTIGSLSRVISVEIRKLLPELKKNKTVLVLINQIRANIAPFGPKEVTPGGNSIKYFASIRIRMARKEFIKREDQVVGQITRVKIAKNKYNTPNLYTDIRLNYKNGIDQMEEIVLLALTHEIIKRKGSSYFYKDKNVARGSANLIKYFKDNLTNLKEIKDSIISM